MKLSNLQPTPYPEGGAGLTVDFTYELDQPIIVAQNESIIEFDEVALIEPGENRVNWPSERFYDYVIVEGKSLKGTEWFPLIDGYDCTAYSEWRTKYESELSTITQLSSAVPTSDLLRNRTIDIQENGDFSPGDTILIRFRLFSDNAAAGWGWLIDNLKIQESSTAVNDLTDQVKFRIFPNPVSSDKLNFSLDLENSYENTMLTIYNIYGSKVLHEPLGFMNNRYSKSIDVQSLSKGMYFLEVRLDQHAAAIKKFIKH